MFAVLQQVKQFFKLVEQLWASMLIMSAQCTIWTRPLPHFSPLHTDSFALVLLYEYKEQKEQSLVKQIDTIFFFLLPVEVSTIWGHFRKRLVMLETVHFTGYRLEGRALPLKKSCAKNSRPPIMISTKLKVLSFPGKVTATTNKIQIPGNEGNFQGKKNQNTVPCLLYSLNSFLLDSTPLLYSAGFVQWLLLLSIALCQNERT